MVTYNIVGSGEAIDCRYALQYDISNLFPRLFLASQFAD